jgi:hypothetical protein
VSFHRNNSLRTGGSALSRNGDNNETLTSSTSPGKRSVPEHPETVSSSWGDKIFIGEAELVVLELYLADAIDRLIAPKRKRGKGSSQAREREQSVAYDRG